MQKIHNVNPDVMNKVTNDKLASELAQALSGMFTIEYHKRIRRYEAQYTILHCKPTRNVADSLLLSREIIAVIANFDDLQVRTINVAKDWIRSSGGRLDPALMIVLHADRRGSEKVRSWGREHGVKVIPIYRPRAGALPPAEMVRRNLASELFSMDPFQVTGPVVNDMDFYGRGTDTLELLRQLQIGRIRSLFGIRKVGKTSVINRLVGLARDSGSPRIAMIDCSVDEFNILNSDSALKAIAKTIRLAANHGYAHISEALKRTVTELVPTLDDLWSQSKGSAIAVIFDEVDYITPASPTRSHWKTNFNPFWREFRVVQQEAQRQGAPLALLVAGVSSHPFRVESIEGVENAVLHFVPEEYLHPFARDASVSMLRDLERRCGLTFSESDRDLIAEVCGDFPYWLRMAGSYLHKALDISGRPYSVPPEQLQQLLDDFIVAEGADIGKVALEDLGRKYPEIISLLRKACSQGSLPLGEGHQLTRYGLAVQHSSAVSVRSKLLQSALLKMSDQGVSLDTMTHDASDTKDQRLQLSTAEWAEELAVLSRRRNLLERNLREYIRVVLKMNSGKGESWGEKVVHSLPAKRRAELTGLAGDVLLSKLYWIELDTIISRHWGYFEHTFNDKKRFQLSMTLLNDRPDAHAKPLDAADLALYRRELTWLESRIA